ncbi:hypothetical protein B0T20DRAFT_78606 [Sordaria brevicollis]|uniref:Uncharacterized protein n=1 Tax=Sordaria brevicollis TaxID=83679 RepID=A0AAE0P1A2_SORBR|nr:hypothetical protein B0T20DRAFT_78606 [Sordaria brevicollis]
MGPRDPRVTKQRGGSVSQPIEPNAAPGESIQANTTEKARSRVVAGRTEKPKSKPQDARTHEANQERAYVAASRRSDRSLEARIQSARLASEIHKKRTGKGFKITTEAVLNDAMYEEEEEPRTARLPYATANYNYGNFATDQHYQRVNAQFAEAFPGLSRPGVMPLALPQYMAMPQYGLTPHHGMHLIHERTQSAPTVPLVSATTATPSRPDMPHGLNARTQSLPVVPPISTNSPTLSSISHRPAGPHTRNSSMSEFSTPPALTPSVGDGTPPLPGLSTPTFGHAEYGSGSNSTTTMQPRYRQSSVASTRSDVPLTPQSAACATPIMSAIPPPTTATSQAADATTKASSTDGGGCGGDIMNPQHLAMDPALYSSYPSGPFEHFNDMYNSLSQQPLDLDESRSFYSPYVVVAAQQQQHQQQDEKSPIFFQTQQQIDNSSSKHKDLDTEPDPLVNPDHDTFVDWNGGDV